MKTTPFRMLTSLLLTLGFLGGWPALAQQRSKDAKAIEELRAKAEKGDAVSQYFLSQKYESGDGGVPKNEVEALSWLRKSAEQGFHLAQAELGSWYYFKKRDPVEAVKWFRKAAEQGLDSAQSYLGLKYWGGDGVEKDFVEAYKWLLLAAAQGDKHAKGSATELERFLTPEQRSEGQKRASAFKPNKKFR